MSNYYPPDRRDEIERESQRRQSRFVSLGALGSLAVVFLLGGFMWGCPNYLVWQQALAGKAKLAEAEWSRKVKIEEAKAELEAAKALRDAEVERARGVAEANKIIGDSLAGNESYLRYLWIQGLNDSTGEVIYVPTEANLPLLEATRKQKP